LQLQDILITGQNKHIFGKIKLVVIIITTFKREFQFHDNIMSVVSKNIRKYRKLAGITQEQLALDIDKSYDFTRRLEFKKGEIGCSLKTLYKISVVLGVSIDKFFEE